MTDPAIPVIHSWVPFPDEPGQVFGVNAQGEFTIQRPEWPMHKASPSSFAWKLAEEIARLAEDNAALQETVDGLRAELQAVLATRTQKG